VPPAGDAWLHEVKFDGWRLQLHKIGPDVWLFTKNGHDYTARLPSIAAAVAALPVRAVILDGELVASDEKGHPDFRALQRRRASAELSVWVFDILAINGRDLRPRPLLERKRILARLMKRCAGNLLRHSESFDDPIALLDVAEREGLEGIVSKHKQAPYRPGVSRQWIKVKTAAWRRSNRERWRLFQKS
jgi:bifunctional non-homologous end joining protein LigD